MFYEFEEKLLRESPPILVSCWQPMAVLQAASIVRTSLESITGEEAGRWTLMMKNMGNWSRWKKVMGWGWELCCSRQQMRTHRARKRIQDERNRTQFDILDFEDWCLFKSKTCYKRCLSRSGCGSSCWMWTWRTGAALAVTKWLP